MKKFTFIGAGSFGFTRTLVRDILTFEAFGDALIYLMDIDEERLNFSKLACEKIVKAGGYNATVKATTDRKEALKNADGVLITILQGGPKIFRSDIEIPKKYGIDINVGDTRGPSGIFRFLRTAPAMLDILKDVEKYCPDAYVLNYTNPMAMLCRYLQEVTIAKITGLCHSVQGTAKMLGEWIGAQEKDVTYTCAGINHQAFYLDFKWKGKDAYPLIRKAIQNEEIANKEQVRNELFRQLGYYPTESSGHNSEYYPFFRKRPDLIEKYCTHGTNWNPGEYAYILNEYLSKENTWKSEIQQWLDEDYVELERSGEYAANIFNAIFGDNTIFEFNGNVRNYGLIENLPEGCCVEVPVVASKVGIRAIHVGKLPDQLAIPINVSARCEELAVKGCVEGDKEMIYHAVMFDPLTCAVLSMAEIRQMVDEMFEANKGFLSHFA